jgi:thiamine monophosphate kinase
MAEDFELILAVAEDAVNDTESFTKAKQISLYLIDKIQGKYAKAQGRAIVLGLLLAALAIIQVRKISKLH